MILKKVVICFTIFSLYQCETKIKENTIFYKSDLRYFKSSEQIDYTVIDQIKKIWSKEIPNLKFVAKDDTLFASDPSLKGVKNILSGPWIISKEKYSSSLECDKKLLIHQNEIKYSFCYSDVFEFLDLQIEKSKTDSYYIYYKDIKINLLSNLNLNEKDYNFDSLIFDLIKNVPFIAYDKFQKKEIYKTIVNDFSMGWQGGIEFFLLEKSKDTIAHFSYIKWIH